MNTPTMTVESVNSPTIVQNAPFVLSIKIVPGHVSDRSWDRKRLIEARMAAGIDKKAAVAEYNAALASHRAGMKATYAAMLTHPDATVVRERILKSGDRTITIRDTSSIRIAAELKIKKQIESLQAKLAAVTGK